MIGNMAEKMSKVRQCWKVHGLGPTGFVWLQLAHVAIKKYMHGTFDGTKLRVLPHIT